MAKCTCLKCKRTWGSNVPHPKRCRFCGSQYWDSDTYKRWTKEEMDAVRRGEFPPGHPRSSVWAMRVKLKCTTSTRKKWTPEEKQLVRDGKFPEKRTHAAVMRMRSILKRKENMHG